MPTPHVGYSWDDFVDTLEEGWEALVGAAEDIVEDIKDTFDIDDIGDFMKMVEKVASGGLQDIADEVMSKFEDLFFEVIKPYLARFAKIQAKYYLKGEKAVLKEIKRWIKKKVDSDTVADILIAFVDQFWDLVTGAPTCMCERGCGKPVADGLAEAKNPYVQAVGKALQYVWPSMQGGGGYLDEYDLPPMYSTSTCLYLYANGSIELLPQARLKDAAVDALGEILSKIDSDAGSAYAAGSPKAYGLYKKWLVDLVGRGATGPKVLGGEHHARYYFEHPDEAADVLLKADKLSDLVLQGLTIAGDLIDTYEEGSGFLKDTGLAGIGSVSADKALMGEWMPAEIGLRAFHRAMRAVELWISQTPEQRKAWKKLDEWESKGIDWPAWFELLGSSMELGEYTFQVKGWEWYSDLYSKYGNADPGSPGYLNLTVGGKELTFVSVESLFKPEDDKWIIRYSIPADPTVGPSVADIGWPQRPIGSVLVSADVYWRWVNAWRDIHEKSRYMAAYEVYKAQWMGLSLYQRYKWINDTPSRGNPAVARDLSEAGSSTPSTSVTVKPTQTVKATQGPSKTVSLGQLRVTGYTSTSFWGNIMKRDFPETLTEAQITEIQAEERRKKTLIVGGVLLAAATVGGILYYRRRNS